MLRIIKSTKNVDARIGEFEKKASPQIVALKE